ncbi:hypothetical protein WJX81_006393 [Elliptochloris bilobata]|uniref:Uncharacterized protein n=1 Tax=Elliptochloris bilobata TaxID=381761 RepID=A0AAW1S513_9CHLO
MERLAKVDEYPATCYSGFAEGCRASTTASAIRSPLLRAAASHIQHLSGVRFQNTAKATAHDVNTVSLPAWGDSAKVKFDGITSYGDALKKTKKAIFNAAMAADATYSERALVIAMAMVKTNTMSASERDPKKDANQADSGAIYSEVALVLAVAMQETCHILVTKRDGGKDFKGTAANYSVLNLNEDMLLQLKTDGYPVDVGSLWRLNDNDQLPTAVKYMVWAFQHWTVRKAVDFLRGGRTTFMQNPPNDKVNDAEEYRNHIQLIYNMIIGDSELLTDDRRVEVDTTHV